MLFSPFDMPSQLSFVYSNLATVSGSDESFCSSVQLFSCVWLFVTPWTATHQASLSITNSQSLLKLMSIESVMPSNHLILCHPLLHLQSFQASGSFQMSQFFTSGGQSIRVSASASVFPMNIQDWFPLGWTRWIFCPLEVSSTSFGSHWTSLLVEGDRSYFTAYRTQKH